MPRHHFHRMRVEIKCMEFAYLRHTAAQAPSAPRNLTVKMHKVIVNREGVRQELEVSRDW